MEDGDIKLVYLGDSRIAVSVLCFHIMSFHPGSGGWISSARAGVEV